MRYFIKNLLLFNSVFLLLFKVALSQVITSSGITNKPHVNNFQELVNKEELHRQPVHVKTNVICRNATEDFMELVDYYTLTELADELSYSSTQKLKKGLMDIKVKGQPVIMIAKINNKDMLVVNPLIYYKGNDLKSPSSISFRAAILGISAKPIPHFTAFLIISILGY